MSDHRDETTFSILMMCLQASSDWGPTGVAVVLLSVMTLWTGQAWVSVNYE